LLVKRKRPFYEDSRELPSLVLLNFARGDEPIAEFALHLYVYLPFFLGVLRIWALRHVAWISCVKHRKIPFDKQS
jgi:hypothetical protein